MLNVGTKQKKEINMGNQARYALKSKMINNAGRAGKANIVDIDKLAKRFSSAASSMNVAMANNVIVILQTESAVIMTYYKTGDVTELKRMLASVMTFDGKYRRFQTPELVDYIVDWLWEWQQLVIDILTAGCWLPEIKEWNEAGRKEK